MKIKDPVRSLIRHIDTASLTTIFLTFLLFAVALIVKGFKHDMLLEAGVFLVSVKLIIMAYHANVKVADMKQSLEDIKETLRRMESKNQAP